MRCNPPVVGHHPRYIAILHKEEFPPSLGESHPGPENSPENKKGWVRIIHHIGVHNKIKNIFLIL